MRTVLMMICQGAFGYIMTHGTWFKMIHSIGPHWSWFIFVKPAPEVSETIGNTKKECQLLD